MRGLGTDIVEIERIRSAMKHSSFMRRVFTEQERAWLDSRGVQAASSAAGLWCAKEAVAKAMGTGFRDGLNLCDIEIGHTELGAPIVCKPHGKFLLSISHCESYATATVVWLEEA